MAKKQSNKGGGSLFKASSTLLELQKKLKGQLFTSVGSDDFLKKVYPTRSTGAIELDMALKTGGWLDNKVNIIYGPPHKGKTFLCMLSCIWENNFNNGLCLWGDIEDEAFDSKWYKKLGGKLELLHLYRPDASKYSGEESMDIFLELIATGDYSIVVLDSLQGQAFLPQRVLDQKISDTNKPAVRAVVNNEFVEKATVLCSRLRTTLLITNHTSDKIGVLFGDTEVLGGPGGKSKNYLSDVILRVGSPTKAGGITGTIKRQKRANVVGNKYEISSSFDTGVDNYDMLITHCVKEDVIETFKNKLVYYDSAADEEIVFKTRKEWVEAIKHDKQLFLSLKADLIQVYSPMPPDKVEDDYEEEDRRQKKTTTNNYLEELDDDLEEL